MTTTRNLIPDKLLGLELAAEFSDLVDKFIQMNYDPHLSTMRNQFNAAHPDFDPDAFLQMIDGYKYKEFLFHGLSVNQVVSLLPRVYYLKGTKRGLQLLLSLLGITTRMYIWWEVQRSHARGTQLAKDFIEDFPNAQIDELENCTLYVYYEGSEELFQRYGVNVDLKLTELCKSFMWVCTNIRQSDDMSNVLLPSNGGNLDDQFLSDRETVLYEVRRHAARYVVPLVQIDGCLIPIYSSRIDLSLLADWHLDNHLLGFMPFYPNSPTVRGAVSSSVVTVPEVMTRLYIWHTLLGQMVLSSDLTLDDGSGFADQQFEFTTDIRLGWLELDMPQGEYVPVYITFETHSTLADLSNLKYEVHRVMTGVNKQYIAGDPVDVVLSDLPLSEVWLHQVHKVQHVPIWYTQEATVRSIQWDRYERFYLYDVTITSLDVAAKNDRYVQDMYYPNTRSYQQTLGMSTIQIPRFINRDDIAGNVSGYRVASTSSHRSEDI